MVPRNSGPSAGMGRPTITPLQSQPVLLRTPPRRLIPSTPSDFTGTTYSYSGRAVLYLTLLGLQSRLGGKPAKFQVDCPPNGTAVLKVLTGTGEGLLLTYD